MSGTTLSFEPGGALTSKLVSELLVRDGPALPPGACVGPFRVQRTLGRGGLGIVYLAERVDGAFEQEVALKLIGVHADDAAEVLLARERRLLARLRHPNIARLLDGGRTGDGLLWFAMDFVAGERIDLWCNARALGIERRLDLLLEVCDAVAYAHARLVVHRDIKPSNILVDADGRPRLLDFGIAAALDDGSDDPARHAATPGYASPEQRRGEAPGVGHDVYQLGRLLDVLAGGVAQDRAVRADLAAIRAHALAERPDARYASVEALAADLRAVRQRRPVSVRAGSAGYRFRRLVMRHRWAFAALATCAFAFASAAALFLWRLDAARVHAEREARTARRIGDLMIGLFQAADPALHQGRVPTVDKVLEDAPARIERELAADPGVLAELLATIGRVHLAMRDFAGAVPPLRRAVALSRGRADVPARELATRLRSLGVALDSSDRRAARDALEEAIALLDPEDAEDARVYNLALQNLAMLQYGAGEATAALARLREALEHGRRMLPESQPARVADLLGLGSVLLGAREDAEALQRYAEAEKLAAEALGESHPYTVLARGGLAVALARAGDHAAAASSIARALQDARRLYGPESANHALALLQQGEVLQRAGRLDEAEAALRSAVDVSRRLGDANDLLSVDAYEALGDVLLAAGDSAGAEAAYRQMSERNRGGAHAQEPDSGQRALKAARALAASGRCGEANARFDEGIARARASDPLLTRALDTARPPCRS